jgi:hypothetical protein
MFATVRENEYATRGKHRIFSPLLCQLSYPAFAIAARPPVQVSELLTKAENVQRSTRRRSSRLARIRVAIPLLYAGGAGNGLAKSRYRQIVAGVG